MNLSDLSAAQLRRAAAIKERIAALQKELTRVLGSAVPAPTAPAVPKKKKRRLSAAGRAAISKAAKARWAKIKAARAK